MAKKIPGKKDAAKKASKPQNQLRSLMAASAAGIILVISGCFAYLAIIELEGNNKTRINRISQNIADNQAAIFNQALDQLRLRMAALAQSPRLLSALKQQDPDVVARYRQELARSFPEASSAQLIELGPLGIASLKKDQAKLRNHIEKDMLRLASNGKTVNPEAYKVDDQWLFSLSQAIKDDQLKYASGALMISLNGDYLKGLLAQMDPGLGKATLMQQTKGSAKIIVSTGTGDNTQFNRRTVTSVPHWSIQFVPSQQLIRHNSLSTTTLWTMLAAAVAIALAAIAIAYVRLQRALASNLEQLTKTTNSDASTFTLPGFAEANSAIYGKLASAKAQASTQQEEAIITANPESTAPAPSLSASELPETIFRAYDIRGIAETELTDAVITAIGLAIGSQALEQGQQAVVVAADGRHSSPRIKQAMIDGLLASGRDVVDIGMVPTPLMYFATHQLGTQSGVMITGSHNPAEYNGIKIVIDGHALSGEAIGNLRTRIIDKQLSTGKGQLESHTIEQDYIDYIINDVAIAQPLKIVLDAGNGVAGAIAPQLFEELGCEVISLFCEVDGDFPNHTRTQPLKRILAT
jgi:phosphomannomutase/phosphoglucomutase